MRAEVFDAGEGSFLWCGMKRKERRAPGIPVPDYLDWDSEETGNPSQALPDHCGSYICRGFQAGDN